jgi:O-antigen/teichoic acid export membrane protein
MSFGLSVLWTLSSRLVVSILGLATTVVVARGIGAEGKGAYELVLLVSALGVAWGGLGVDMAVIYYVGKGVLADHDLKPALLGYSVVWGSVVAAITFLLGQQLGDSVLRSVDASLLVLASALIPPLMMLSCLRAALLGRNQLLAYNGVNIVQAVASCLLMALVLLALGSGLYGAIGAYAASSLLALGLLLWKERTSLAGSSISRAVATVWQLVRFGSKAQIGNVLLFLSYRADLLILNMFLGTAAVGYYTVAVALSEAIWYLPRTVALNLLPRVASSRDDDAERLTPLVCRTTLILSLLLALGLAAAGPLIIRLLFTEEFLPSVLPLWLLLPGVVAASVVAPIASHQVGQGRPLTSLYVALLSTPICLPAYLLLIPRFGLAGAAVASSISYLSMTALQLYFLQRVSSIRLVELFVPQADDWLLYRRLLLRLRAPRTLL